ncbi:hypothetical protein DFH07DRAFT_786054, partial [Mycena maculata]
MTQISTPGPSTGAGPSAGPQLQPPPPARTRRTHVSAGVAVALSKLPKASKRQKNTEIAARNAERELKHAQHFHDASLHPDDSSDNESLITVSDDEDALSPASRLHAAIGKLSPESGKAVLRALHSNKRGRDDEVPKAKPISKKARVEISVALGMALPKAFHQCIHDLYNHHVYTPLSMFTTPSLRTINSKAATMAMCKLNAAEPGEKQLRLLDMAVFEANVKKETDLDRAEWTEAAENYVEFIAIVEGTGSAAETRWHAHFAHFTNSGDPKRNFVAIHATDIAIRKDYASQPFAYDRELYRTDLGTAITEQRINEGILVLTAAGGAPPPPSAANGGGSRGGGRGGRGAGGRGG